MQSGSADTRDDINVAVGRRIRETRLDKGLKQKVLAEIVDMDPKYLIRIENEHSGISRELLIRIGHVLGRGLDYLYIDDPELEADRPEPEGAFPFSDVSFLTSSGCRFFVKFLPQAWACGFFVQFFVK